MFTPLSQVIILYCHPERSEGSILKLQDKLRAARVIYLEAQSAEKVSHVYKI